MQHLDDSTLALYVERQLEGQQLDTLREHIDSCDSCRELVIGLAARDRQLAQGSPEPAGRTREVLAAGEQVGRYVIEDLVGAGAMGAVYAARDTELDRKVALKVMRHRGVPIAARMRREAQALARIAHRGVVAVHDVGTHDGKIYIAMEFVAGGTLKKWLHQETRSVGAILSVMLSAARGLAAAHDVGLVHRDVKPDNILVDREEVARIGDFGLAAVGEEEVGSEGAGAFDTELTASGTLVGTPAYMAPEQLAGGVVTARSDQFSFCVTLYEALFDRRPYPGKTIEDIQRSMKSPLRFPDHPRVPAHVRKALARGLAIEPEQRFESMLALVKVLDPAPRRRRLFIGVGAAAVVAALVGSVAVARSTVATAAEPCRDGDRKLVGVWDAARKADVKRAFLATNAPYAEDAWRGFERALDRYAASWTAMHRSTCEATRVHGSQTEHELELRMWCLDDRLREARTLTESLRTATKQSVSRAVTAADRLPTVDMCADTQALAQKLPPSDAARTKTDRVREDLAQVKTLWNLGQFEKARTLSAEVSKAAAALEYAPLEADALIEESRIGFLIDGDAKATEQMLLKALWAADRGRDDHLRARAWNLLYFIIGSAQQRFDEAAKTYEHASAALERLVGAETLEAQLLGNHGQVLTLEGKYEEAARVLERALAILERTVGPDHIETGNACAALANAYLRLGALDQSLGFAQRAYDVHARTLGPKHPETAKSLFSIGIALEDLGRYDEAADKLLQSIAILEAALGKDHIDLPTSLDELGVIRRKQLRLDEALALHQRALAIREPKLGEHNETAISLDNIGIVLGMLDRHEEALKYHQRALAMTEKIMGPDNIETATSRGYLANTYLGLGRLSEALEMFRSVLATTEKALGPDAFDNSFPLSGIGQTYLNMKKPAEAIAPLERALKLRGTQNDPMSTAEVKFALGRALWEAKRDRARARKLVEEARPFYKEANDSDVENWLAAHR